MADEGNNPQGNADGTFSNEEAARLVGSILDTSSGATQEPDSEPDMEVSEDVIEDDDDAEIEAIDNDEYEEISEPDDEEAEELLFEIGGEQISLDDIEKGYQRHSDYSQKTQAIAEERKVMEQERSSIAQEREHLRQMLEVAQTSVAQETDWVQLATDDPLEYTRQRAIFEATRATTEAKTAEAERLRAVEQHEKQIQLQSYVQKQTELMVAGIPALAGENAPSYKSNISKYMMDVGYSKDELAQLFDHRAVIAFDKARQFDELKSKEKTVAKKVKGKQRILKPGATKTKRMSTAKSQQQAHARLRKSGSVDDAVALLMGS